MCSIHSSQSISATETTLRSLSLLPDLTSQSAKESVVIPAINLDTPDPHKQVRCLHREERVCCTIILEGEFSRIVVYCLRINCLCTADVCLPSLALSAIQVPCKKTPSSRPQVQAVDRVRAAHKRPAHCIGYASTLPVVCLMC